MDTPNTDNDELMYTALGEDKYMIPLLQGATEPTAKDGIIFVDYMTPVYNSCLKCVDHGLMIRQFRETYGKHAFGITPKGRKLVASKANEQKQQIAAIDHSMDKATAAKIAEMSRKPDSGIGGVTNDEICIMRHALGQTSQGASSHRNHFCADSNDLDTCRALVAKGLMFEGRKVSDVPDQLFHVTQEGKNVVAASWKTSRATVPAMITLPKTQLTELLQALVKGRSYAQHSLREISGESEIKDAFREMIQKDIDSMEKALEAGIQTIQPKV